MMGSKIGLGIKNLFTGLYRKPLIKIEKIHDKLELMDKNLDKGISANEVWDLIISELKR